MFYFILFLPYLIDANTKHRPLYITTKSFRNGALIITVTTEIISIVAVLPQDIVVFTALHYMCLISTMGPELCHLSLFHLLFLLCVVLLSTLIHW